jgi:hypothetical protein
MNDDSSKGGDETERIMSKCKNIKMEIIHLKNCQEKIGQILE